MPGVLIKVKSITRNLTEAERRVAHYICQNPEKTALTSISELADVNEVSIASVSRLSKRLGYTNFKELKTDIGQELLPNNNISSIYQAITPEDNEEEIIEKVFRGNIKSLEDTLKIQERSDLIRAAQEIEKSPRVVCFGIGSSGQVAREAALRFSLVDTQAEAYCDSQEILIQALRMKKSEIALGFSHSGRTKITVEALRLASDNGAVTIGISNYLQSPLHRVSEIFLCTAFPENRVKAAALSSLLAQLCLIDALYLLIARYKNIYKKTESFNQFSEDLLRIREKENGKVSP